METKTFTDKQGREIELRCEIEGELISAYHGGSKIGEFHFDFREGAGPDDICALVTNMALDHQPGYRRCGTGTAIVQWMEELQDCPVCFGRSDGVKTDDGAYLIQDGPAFAESIGRKRRDGML